MRPSGNSASVRIRKVLTPVENPDPAIGVTADCWVAVTLPDRRAATPGLLKSAFSAGPSFRVEWLHRLSAGIPSGVHFRLRYRPGLQIPTGPDAREDAACCLRRTIDRMLAHRRRWGVCLSYLQPAATLGLQKPIPVPFPVQPKYVHSRSKVYLADSPAAAQTQISNRL